LPNSQKSNYKDGDSYTRKSREEGYRSRASFKLKEINSKESLLNKGMSVLDLGSFPGGWTQVSKECVGNRGKVVGVDIKEIVKINECLFIHKSIDKLTKEDFNKFEPILPFDLVLSDMAPNISGIRERDNAQMIYLIDKTLFAIDAFLKVGGSAVIKVFQGESLDYTREALIDRFKKIKVFKPKSSRSNSKETYIIGKKLVKENE
tara:strand:+ start:13721 stop:14335 length:615 start_codon:yes stop_codon:yes gene_type:complete